MAPRGPQKGQKSILMGSLVVLDPNASPKKISSIFRTGCHKACTCPLNGAFGHQLYFYFSADSSECKQAHLIPTFNFRLIVSILRPLIVNSEIQLTGYVKQ